MLRNILLPTKRNGFRRYLYRCFILGIETSCDDTCAAVVNMEGNLLSELVDSQTNISSRCGGIIPTVAQELHKAKINPTVNKALSNASIDFKDLVAIAVTTKPGMPLSLRIGKNFAIEKAKIYGKPLIPIHHMEAHALTIRMLNPSVEFPFLVLLISGGNSLLAVAHDVDKFSMLGTRVDISPGDCLDKISRFLGLTGHQGTHNTVSGGRAIELMASSNNLACIDLNPVNQGAIKSCNFSFYPIQAAVFSHVKKHGKPEGPELARICASVLLAMSRQLNNKLLRAMMYCHRYLEGKQPDTLVVSGGVGSNQLIRSALELACIEFQYRLLCPPPHYCTDNGAMIAWNGYELFRRNKNIVSDVESVDFCSRAPFGEDISAKIKSLDLSIPRIKLKHIFVR